MRYPKFLQDKGTIGFIAPSFGCVTEPYNHRFDSAIRKFNKLGYKTVEGPNCRVQVGEGKSNTPEACAAEANDFFTSNKSDIIISCGGGELMCEDIPYFDFKAISEAEPKWFMGYSDNTNLTFLLTTLCDTASVYGPCAGEFGMEPWHKSLQDSMNILTGKCLTVSNYDMWEHEQEEEPASPLSPYNLTTPYRQTLAGSASIGTSFSGRLVGGCMDCLINLAGTEFDKVSEFADKYAGDGIIWFLEACDLNAMSIRRALWNLEHAGWFKHVKGFVIGRPRLYDDAFGDFDRIKAVTGILDKYNVPIILDTDIGHLSPMMPIISGSYATVTCGDNNISIDMKLV